MADSSGILKGHSDQVTTIASGFSLKENEDSLFLISGSRDKTIIKWKLYEKEQAGLIGVPDSTLKDHTHFVSDLSLSIDNSFAMSASWDKTLILWNLQANSPFKTFDGHQSEVYSVTFSPDNRQILSTGAERVIKLWNTLGDCKFSSEEGDNHSDWVSCIRYSPNQNSHPYFATVGWDGVLKIWNSNFQLQQSIKAHQSPINSLSISSDGQYLATGSKDKKLCIWNILNLSSPYREYDAGSNINSVAFNPKFQWVAVGTDQGIQIFNLQNSSNASAYRVESESITTKVGEGKNLHCTSLAWNSLGKKLFAGFTDGIIRTFTFETDN